MTNEEKQLLVKDLCARLPYGVQVYVERDRYAQATLLGVDTKRFSIIWGGSNWSSTSDIEGHHIEQYKQLIKPYLRPMESMTLTEECEFCRLFECDSVNVMFGYIHWMVGGCCDYDDFDIEFSKLAKVIDWLNEHYFDYRNLIEKGLALEAPENMYN